MKHSSFFPLKRSRHLLSLPLETKLANSFSLGPTPPGGSQPVHLVVHLPSPAQHPVQIIPISSSPPCQITRPFPCVCMLSPMDLALRHPLAENGAKPTLFKSMLGQQHLLCEVQPLRHVLSSFIKRFKIFLPGPGPFLICSEPSKKENPDEMT